VFGTDNSTDGGTTFPNLRKIYSAGITLPFTRGYVHIAARNHASIKYSFGPDAILHWDNVSFDGPVIAPARSYEIPDNKAMGTYDVYADAPTVMSLGYQIQDGLGSKAAGIYDPVNSIGPLRFLNVDTSGRTAAQLSFNAFFNTSQVTANATWWHQGP
jgi:hypothetical protein